MESSELSALVKLLEQRNEELEERERSLADQAEELQSQKEELTAAIEELVDKNNSLTSALLSLRQRNHELDQLLYRASHDLRTPVASLKGLMNIVKGEGMNPTQQIAFDHMQKQVNRMQSVLRALTALAQGAFNEITSQHVELTGIVRQAWSELDELPSHASATITISEGDQHFRTDANLILIALKCLLSNALIFCPDGQPPVIGVMITRYEKDVLITIADNGEGISPEIEGRLFEMFFRGSERSAGLGLGLYIVKSIVDRLSGSITWKRKTQGTEFTLHVPELI